MASGLPYYFILITCIVPWGHKSNLTQVLRSCNRESYSVTYCLMESCKYKALFSTSKLPGLSLKFIIYVTNNLQSNLDWQILGIVLDVCRIPESIWQRWLRNIRVEIIIIIEIILVKNAFSLAFTFIKRTCVDLNSNKVRLLYEYNYSNTRIL